MDNNDIAQQEALKKLYEYAANLLVNEKRSPAETREALVKQGIDLESAGIIVDQLETKIQTAKKERANKDMLYGALWCIGGIVATASGIGLIFWGAILFGAIQFFKGVANL